MNPPVTGLAPSIVYVDGGLVLTLINCEQPCKTCGQPLVKNPLCSGDWHPTYRSNDELLRYCNNPQCPCYGHMYPYISIPWGFISNRRKMDVAKMCACLSGRGMIEMKKVAREVKTGELQLFLEDFRRKANLSPMVLSVACERLGL